MVKLPGAVERRAGVLIERGSLFERYGRSDNPAMQKRDYDTALVRAFAVLLRRDRQRQAELDSEQ